MRDSGKWVEAPKTRVIRPKPPTAPRKPPVQGHAEAGHGQPGHGPRLAWGGAEHAQPGRPDLQDVLGVNRQQCHCAAKEHRQQVDGHHREEQPGAADVGEAAQHLAQAAAATGRRRVAAGALADGQGRRQGDEGDTVLAAWIGRAEWNRASRRPASAGAAIEAT